MSDAAMTVRPLLHVPVAQLVEVTQAEGPGLRFALWVQGCPLRCPGCCNPEMQPFRGGQHLTVDALMASLHGAVARHGVEGISLLGGEPMAHAAPLAEFARRTRHDGLSVMLYTGLTLKQLTVARDPHQLALLAHCDVVVDGPYERERPDTRRRWIGSTNQRVHLLTDRYRPDDPCWRESDTLEIRLRGRQLTVNGFPAPRAVGVWRR